MTSIKQLTINDLKAHKEHIIEELRDYCMHYELKRFEMLLDMLCKTHDKIREAEDKL